jgi:hypothetical protein
VIASLKVAPKATPNMTYSRVIIAPHAATLAIPEVPDGTFNPQADDQVTISLGIVKATGGYDAIRANAFAVDQVTAAVAVGGSVTLSYAGTNAPGRVVGP